MAGLKTVVTEYQELSKVWSKGKNRDSLKVSTMPDVLLHTAHLPPHQRPGG